MTFTPTRDYYDHMTNLTKEHFDKQIKSLPSKLDLRKLKDDIVLSVARGFKNEHEYFEERFDKLEKLLKLSEQVQEHSRQIRRLEEALNIKI